MLATAASTVAGIVPAVVVVAAAAVSVAGDVVVAL
jgi:hypothetical protein